MIDGLGMFQTPVQRKAGAKHVPIAIEGVANMLATVTYCLTSASIHNEWMSVQVTDILRLSEHQNSPKRFVQ